PEPRAEHARSEHRLEHQRSDRFEQRSEHRGDHQRPEPILLPGESISKYQPHSALPAAAAPVAPRTESAPRPRPSTEYSIDASAFTAGSMVLPGESLAKYGKQRQSPHAAIETIEAEVVTPEHQEHGVQQDHESAGPIPRHFDEETDSEARIEAPRVFNRV